tara:strand:+ start:5013 stop:5201 length:189 start_codon:yes stop_codon:yes gene_type:complete
MRVKSVKKGKSIKFEVWQTNNIGRNDKVSTFDFRKDAKALADFHNKNQVWQVNGGLPKFLLD